MTAPSLEREGQVLVLRLGDDDNVLDDDRVSALHAVLDEVEATTGPAALVTTGAGKVYSTGLSPDAARRPDGDAYVGRVEALLARVLVLPLPTVAAVNGHAFGGGALLSLAHDFRLMRSGQGWWCLPEVTLELPFPEGMSALLTAKLQPQVALEAMTTARRYDAAAAVADAVVDAEALEGEVLAAAVARAATLTENRGQALGVVKARLYAHAARRLRRRHVPADGDE